MTDQDEEAIYISPSRLPIAGFSEKTGTYMAFADDIEAEVIPDDNMVTITDDKGLFNLRLKHDKAERAGMAILTALNVAGKLKSKTVISSDATLETALETLREIEFLHQKRISPVDGPYCAECTTHISDPVEWPCLTAETIVAMQKH